MYNEFFHMREMPFGLEPDSRFLVLAEEHKKALSTLIYAMQEREGWALILGEAGVGKTTLVMALLRKMGEAVIPAVITNPLLEPMDFFNLAALELGMPGPYESKGQFIIDLGQLINQCRQQNRILLLVVDEAHSLTPRLLEELRLLGNLDGTAPRVLNIFLVGQPKLLTLMKEAGVKGLMQRLRRHHLLLALSEKETAQYVRRRIEVAGGPPDIFDDEALREVHYITGGTPRLINALCDQALLNAFSNNRRQVDRNLVLQAALQSTDLLWPQPEAVQPSEPIQQEPKPQEEHLPEETAAEAQIEETAPTPPEEEIAPEPPLESTLGEVLSQSDPLPLLEPEPEPEAMPEQVPPPGQEPLEATLSRVMGKSQPASEKEPEPDPKQALEPKAEPDDIPESIRDLLEPAAKDKTPSGLGSQAKPHLTPPPDRHKRRSGMLGRLLLFVVFLLALLAAVHLLTNPEALREAARIWQTITVELGLEPSATDTGASKQDDPAGQKELRVKKPIPTAEEPGPPPAGAPRQPKDDTASGNR